MTRVGWRQWGYWCVSGLLAFTACQGANGRDGKDGLPGTSLSDAGAPSQDGGGTRADSGAAGNQGTAAAGATADGGAAEPDDQLCGALAEPCCPGFACSAGLSCIGGACVDPSITDYGEPCDVDAECLGGLCLPSGDGAYQCSARCALASDCLPGWSCQTVATIAAQACQCQASAETCNGADDDCNGTIDDDVVTTPLCAGELGHGATCHEGECSCTGLTCGPLCVDEQNDIDNCGECHHHCEIGCGAGKCVVPTSVSVGSERACALLSDGTVRCWGINNGALGTGGSLDLERPTPILVTGVVQLELGQNHGCALLSNGTLRCWGSNGAGEVGIGEAGGGSTPTLVPGLTGVTHIAAGDKHTCAVVAGGQVYCWGFNLDQQVGVEARSFVRSPLLVEGLTKVSKLALGDSHSCALFDDATVACWGNNDSGQLGDQTDVSRAQPKPVPSLSAVKNLVAGSHHTCALLAGGTVSCWGANDGGQLGDTTKEARDKPTPVAGLTGVVALAAGGSVTLAQTAQTFLTSWGWSSAGASPLIDWAMAQDGLEPGKAGAAFDANSYTGCVLYADGIERSMCWGTATIPKSRVVWN